MSNLLTEKYLNAVREANEEYAEVDYSENALECGASQTAGWTTGLTIICIFFVLIGTIGTISAGYGFYTLFGPQPKLTAKEKAELNRQPREIKEFKKNYEAARQKFFPMLTYLEVMKLVLALCFLAAVMMLVVRSKKARSFAIGICAMALLYHICAVGVNFWMLSESGGSLNQMFDTALDDARRQGGLSKEEHEKAKSFVMNSVSMGMTIGLAIVFLVRVLFYGFVIAYFFQGEIKQIFGEDGFDYLRPKDEDEIIPVSV